MGTGPKGSSRTSGIRGQRLVLWKIRRTTPTTEQKITSAPLRHQPGPPRGPEEDWCRAVMHMTSKSALVAIAWIHHDTALVAFRAFTKWVEFMI